MKELTGVTAVMKVIYGDNIAASGLANGTTSSSWRTRHLRIRASLLKQALDYETDAAGGQRKLIHVSGLDLVADGFTKPLFGAAFQHFVENLGMNAPFLRPEDPEIRAAQVRSHGSRERVHAGVFWLGRLCCPKLKLWNSKEKKMKRIHFGLQRWF